MGASVCPCGAQCIIADKPGKCDGAVTNPCATIKCGDGNACTADTCNPKTGKCEFPAMKKGSKCQDGDKCTLDDKCDGGGKCTAGAKDPNCGKPPPAGCCNVTAECKGGVCVKGAGQAHGVCKSTTQLQAGECWSAAQCDGKKCLAPNVCACGLNCFAPDKPGWVSAFTRLQERGRVV
ncbi:MAG TPA: hypothetical protein EYP98_06070, partial [Planctomycetes bacterium]|nr:hypothetical protein [Planctomycetota bacterium]